MPEIPSGKPPFRILLAVTVEKTTISDLRNGLHKMKVVGQSASGLDNGHGVLRCQLVNELVVASFVKVIQAIV